MEKTLNRIELRGHVGQDPRISETGGNTVVNFSMATHEILKDRNGNIRQETTWHNIVAWAGRGMPYFEEIRKGTCVYVVGRVRNQKYTASDGTERMYNDVLATRIVLERKPEDPFSEGSGFSPVSRE